LSIDKKDRQRGSEESDAPLLLESDGATEDGDVVIGGEQGDQGEHGAAEDLEGAESIEPQPTRRL
jgi:hypothetical protein